MSQTAPSVSPGDFQGFGTPLVHQPEFSNPGKGVHAPNEGKPIAVVKRADGSTASVQGQIPNTSVVFSSPA